MKKYEYKFADIGLVDSVLGSVRIETLQEEANKLGAEGWQLVHVHQGRVAIFMREIASA